MKAPGSDEAPRRQPDQPRVTSLRKHHRSARHGLFESGGHPGIRFIVPTLLLVEGFRFFFFANEGREAAHVHVQRGDGLAKFWLRPVSLAWSDGMKTQELSRAEVLVVENREIFEAKWHEFFSRKN